MGSNPITFQSLYLFCTSSFVKFTSSCGISTYSFIVWSHCLKYFFIINCEFADTFSFVATTSSILVSLVYSSVHSSSTFSEIFASFFVFCNLFSFTIFIVIIKLVKNAIIHIAIIYCFFMAIPSHSSLY